MKSGSVPGLDKPVCRLVQGTELFKSWEPGQAFELLDAIYEKGCTAFDTAHFYGDGHCERVLGQWMATRGVRERSVVITKGAHHDDQRKRVTPADIASDLRDSLDRLQTGYIDLYLLHRDDPSVSVGPIMEGLNEHLAAGKVRAIGASNWSHQRIIEANKFADETGLVPFAASSPHFSLAEQLRPPWEDCVSITGPSMASVRKWYSATQMPVFSWASLSLGFLSGRVSRDSIASDPHSLTMRSFGGKENFEMLDRATWLARRKGLQVAQIAVAYLMNQPLNLFTIIASASAGEFEENGEAIELKLTPQELAWLDLESDERPEGGPSLMK